MLSGSDAEAENQMSVLVVEVAGAVGFVREEGYSQKVSSGLALGEESREQVSSPCKRDREAGIHEREQTRRY